MKKPINNKQFLCTKQKWGDCECSDSCRRGNPEVLGTCQNSDCYDGMLWTGEEYEDCPNCTEGLVLG